MVSGSGDEQKMLARARKTEWGWWMEGRGRLWKLQATKISVYYMSFAMSFLYPVSRSVLFVTARILVCEQAFWLGIG